VVKYLLDTDSISYYLRGTPGVVARLQALRPVQVGLPAPVLYESRAGMLRLPRSARRSRLLGALDRFVALIAVVPFDGPAAEAAAVVRASLEARGAPIGPIDTAIAGIALARKATLVTRNGREFGRVDGLEIENWYDSAPQARG
jgi:tRNA(fMet)-specific endonuclease VapC